CRSWSRSAPSGTCGPSSARATAPVCWRSTPRSICRPRSFVGSTRCSRSGRPAVMTPAIVPTAAPAPAPASAEAARSPMISIPPILERLAYRYPAVLADAVTEYEPGHRIVAVKNVTVSEEFFQGHFPGTPLMPGVLMIESLTQVATLLVAGPDLDGRRARLRGVYNAKFRRQVVPGDRLQLEVTMGRRRGA